MEEENQVFGKDAEAVDSNMNLESEDFNFYHQNKEEAKKNIDSSSADLSDFIDSLIQDVPDPSAEEVNSGIEKILEITHPTESKTETSKTNKSKKVTFKVLFIAALLSILSFSCLYVVGSSHDIRIENGFVTFAKNTIKIVFFGEEKEEYITVDALLTDLEVHGYKNILFPQEFVYNTDVYKSTTPEYVDQHVKQVNFKINNGTDLFAFSIYNQKVRGDADYVNLDNMKCIVINDTCIYISEINDETTIDFIHDEHYFFITSNVPYSDMIKIAQSIK